MHLQNVGAAISLVMDDSYYRKIDCPVSLAGDDNSMATTASSFHEDLDDIFSSFDDNDDYNSSDFENDDRTNTSIRSILDSNFLLKRQQKATFFVKPEQKTTRAPSMFSNSDSTTNQKSSRANSLESTFNIKNVESASTSAADPADSTTETSKNVQSTVADTLNISKNIDKINSNNDNPLETISKDEPVEITANANDDNTNSSNSRLTHRQRNHTFSSFHHIKNSLSGSTIIVPDDCEVPPVPKFLHSPSSLNSLKPDTATRSTETPRKASLGTVLPFPTSSTSSNFAYSNTKNTKYIDHLSSAVTGPVSRRTSISRIFNVGRSKKTRSNSKTGNGCAQPSLTLSTFRKNSIAESIEEAPPVLQQQYSATSNNLPVAPQISSINRFPHFHKPTSMNASSASNKIEFKNPFSASPAGSTPNLQAPVITDSANTNLPLPCRVRQNSWSTNGSNNPESPQTPTSTVYPHPIMIQSSNSRKSSVVLEPISATASNGPVPVEHVSFFKSTFSKKSKVW